MGHACQATTEDYRKWAERQLAGYEAYMPSALANGERGPGQRENSGNDDGKPELRVVSA